MFRRLAPFLVAAATVASARAAHAQDAPPIVHPLYVHMPDAPEDDALRRAFTAAAARYGLHPVEVVDVPAPPPPRAPDLVKSGVLDVQKIAFGEALHDLDAAAAEVATTGGAGLSADDLSDLYLNRAIATGHADWNATADAPPNEARTRAYADYLRAATLTPARALNPREIPPQAVADFARAVAEIRQRSRGTLSVSGSADAQVALDGGAPMPVAGGVVLRDLGYGEHLIRVEEMGHVGWGAVVSINQPTQDLAIPARAVLGLDGATAAMHARRMGARFALVLEPKGGAHAPIGLRLIDTTGQERDAAMIPSASEAGLLDSSVMRLDEAARRIAQVDAPPPTPVAANDAGTLAPPVLIGPPAQKARFSDDPTAWARDHWPLLAAVGVVLTSTFVLSLAVSANR